MMINRNFVLFKTLAVALTLPLVQRPSYPPVISEIRRQLGVTAHTAHGVAEQLVDKIDWVFTNSDARSSPQAYFEINLNNDFLSFILLGIPMPDRPKMNCLESMALSQILAGNWSVSMLRDGYLSSLRKGVIGEVNPIEDLLKLQDASFYQPKSNASTGNLSVGDMVVFGPKCDQLLSKKCYHIGICVSMDGGAAHPGPQIMSLWNIPVSTFTQIGISELLTEVSADQRDIGKITLRRLQKRTTLTDTQANQILGHLFRFGLVTDDGTPILTYATMDACEHLKFPDEMNISDKILEQIKLKIIVANRENQEENPFLNLSTSLSDLVVVKSVAIAAKSETAISDVFDTLRAVAYSRLSEGNRTQQLANLREKWHISEGSILDRIIKKNNKTVYGGAFKLNLSGLDLRHVDFSGVDLLGVNFTDAQTAGALFNGVRLSQDQVRQILSLPKPASLKGANLTYIDFSGLDLSAVDLSGATVLGAKFGGAATAGANFTGVPLALDQVSDILCSKPASLRGALLSKLDLSSANVGDTDFSWSDLSNVTICDPESGFQGCNFSGVKTSDLSIRGELTVVQAQDVIEGSNGSISQDTWTSIIYSHPHLIPLILSKLPETDWMYILQEYHCQHSESELPPIHDSGLFNSLVKIIPRVLASNLDTDSKKSMIDFVLHHGSLSGWSGLSGCLSHSDPDISTWAWGKYLDPNNGLTSQQKKEILEAVSRHSIAPVFEHCAQLLEGRDVGLKDFVRAKLLEDPEKLVTLVQDKQVTLANFPGLLDQSLHRLTSLEKKAFLDALQLPLCEALTHSDTEVRQWGLAQLQGSTIYTPSDAWAILSPQLSTMLYSPVFAPMALSILSDILSKSDPVLPGQIFGSPQGQEALGKVIEFALQTTGVCATPAWAILKQVPPSSQLWVQLSRHPLWEFDTLSRCANDALHVLGRCVSGGVHKIALHHNVPTRGFMEWSLRQPHLRTQVALVRTSWWQRIFGRSPAAVAPMSTVPLGLALEVGGEPSQA